MSLTDAELAELERLEKEATPGPWEPCFHLQSPGNDASCGCGQPGTIWAADQEHVVLSIGLGTGDPDGLAPAVMPRKTQLYDAALVVAARNALPSLIAELRAARARIRELERKLTAENDWLADGFEMFHGAVATGGKTEGEP